MTTARPLAAPALCTAALSSLFALAACSGGVTSTGPIDGDAAMKHVRHLCETIGARPFGSEKLAAATDYLSSEIVKLGLEPKRHEIVDEPSGKTIRNLYCQIDGADPKDGPILMIAAHYDTKNTTGFPEPHYNFPFVGAIDGGGAPAVLLELARCIKAREPKSVPNVWLYWIDAEESIDFQWNHERALIGSKAFGRWLVREKVMPRVKTFVLIDLIGDKDIKIDEDGKSNPQLQQIFKETAAAMDISDRVYKYKSAATDDHEVFRDFGVPAVLLIDFTHRIGQQRFAEMNPNAKMPDPEGYAQWWHTAEDTVDKMSPESLAFAGNLVFAALPELEKFVLKRK
ncbi:MAG: M28 family peptidase [Planctomycetota bacterium]